MAMNRLRDIKPLAITATEAATSVRRPEISETSISREDHLSGDRNRVTISAVFERAIWQCL